MGIGKEALEELLLQIILIGVKAPGKRTGAYSTKEVLELCSLRNS